VGPVRLPFFASLSAMTPAQSWLNVLPVPDSTYDFLDSAFLLIAFGSGLELCSLATGDFMQPNQYDAATTTAVCLWCYSQYLKGTSRARDGQTFCSRKCEIEARFWLHDNLKSATE
jgi:hypothetical protein